MRWWNDGWHACSCCIETLSGGFLNVQNVLLKILSSSTDHFLHGPARGLCRISDTVSPVPRGWQRLLIWAPATSIALLLSPTRWLCVNYWRCLTTVRRLGTFSRARRRLRVGCYHVCKLKYSNSDIAKRHRRQTKNLSPKLQCATSQAANDVTVKRVVAEGGVIADAKSRARTKCRFKILWFAAHHWKTKANTLMSPRCKGEQRRVSQCSRHVYQLDLLLR